MNLSRFIVLGLVVLFFGINSVYSACVNEPDEVIVYSGDINLGVVDTDERIYIREDLSDDPLRVEYYFANNEGGCFDSNTNMRMKLTPSGAEVVADDLITTYDSDLKMNISKFTFNFNLAYNLTTSISSSYLVEPTSGSSAIGSLLFDIDTTDPLIVVYSNSHPNGLVQGGDEVEVLYTVADSQSLLKTLIVSGGVTEIVNFENNENSYDGEIRATLNNNRDYVIRVTDKLGYETVETISFTVDSDAPTVTSLSKTYTYDGVQGVIFSAVISDDSFGIVSDTPNVVGDFSEVNPSVTSLVASCSRRDNTSFNCEWSEFDVTIGSTSTVNLRFTVSDSLGNSNTITRQESILVDSAGPEVIEFQLLNGNGVANVFSSDDENVKLTIKFRDPSMITNDPPQIVEDFDIIPTPTRDCTYSEDEGQCIWEFGDSLSRYNGVDNKSVIFEVTLVDFFSNIRTVQLNVNIDNSLPVLKSLEVIETESIKDGILKSGERFDFRVEVSDSNLFSNGYFIYGDFSTIDFRAGLDNKTPECSNIDSEVLRCDFKNIEAENGYMNRTINIYISDTSGNTIMVPYNIEVLKIGTEVVSSFKIDDVVVTNPLNRNLVIESGTNAWFEGVVENKDNSMTLVNYQLVDCNPSGFDPIIVHDFSLFPEENVVVSEEGDEEFALKIRLKNHPNIADLDEKRMTCQMAVLKRDEQTAYPPEIIEFGLIVTFYDTPRGDLIKAHAQQLLDEIEEISFMGDWFDTIYSIYDVLNNVCLLVSNGVGILSAVDNVWQGVEWLMKPTGFFTVGATSEIIGRQSQGIRNFHNGMASLVEEGPVKYVCDFVTCRNGGLLGSLVIDGADEFSGGLVSDVSEGIDYACSGFGVFEEGS